MQRCYGTSRGYALTLSQTLWSTEAYNRLKETSLQAASAEASFLGAQQDLLLRISQAYFGILSARDQLATNRAARETFANLLNQARAREQTGVGPRSDVEQAQSFYDATEQSVIDAQNALEDAQLMMTEIAGSPADEIAPLREDIPLAAPDPVTVEAWVVSARQDNPDVRAAELQLKAAERDIAAQRGKGLPTFSLSGTGTRQWQDPTIGGNQTFDSVGVFFNWPLFQGGAIASAVHQARALYSEARAAYDSTQRDAERQTRSAYRGVVSGIQRIAAARRAVESGRDAVEASRRNVEFGTGNEFNLLSAQNNYYAAQRAYNQARYDYLTSELTLKRQAGRLTEEDLAAIDALLVPHGN
jgi:outer membrane protein